MTGGYLNECLSDTKLVHPTKWAIGLESQGFFLVSFAFDFIGDLEHLTSFIFFCFSVFSIFFSIE